MNEYESWLNKAEAVERRKKTAKLELVVVRCILLIEKEVEKLLAQKGRGN